MRTITECKICQGNQLITIKKYHTTPQLNVTWGKIFQDLFPSEKFISIRLCICYQCGFLFYQDVFDEIEIKKLYATEGRYETAGERNLKPGRKRELERLFNYIDCHIPFSNVNSIIDVGAGDFEVLNRLMARYPEKAFTAIDPSFNGNSYKKSKVLHDMVEDSIFTECYDLVMITHVLEHVADLRLFMKHVLPLVGKYVYIEVPFQVGPALFLTRAVNSQHINYFTPETLQFLLEESGLKVERLHFENDWYRHNGMPGMIRIIAVRTETTIVAKNSSLIQAVRHLLSPWPFIKSFYFTK